MRKFFFETHTIKQFSSLIYRFENGENTESAEIEDDYYYYCESGIETTESELTDEVNCHDYYYYCESGIETKLSSLSASKIVRLLLLLRERY